MKGLSVPILCVCLLLMAVAFAFTPSTLTACGGDGFTTSQTGCSGGSCGGGGGALRAPITAAPVPEFAMTTSDGNMQRQMPSSRAIMAQRGTAPRAGIELPIASAGRDLKSAPAATLVAYDSSGPTHESTSDGKNTLVMTSKRQALEVPVTPEPSTKLKLTFGK